MKNIKESNVLPQDKYDFRSDEVKSDKTMWKLLTFKIVFVVVLIVGIVMMSSKMSRQYKTSNDLIEKSIKEAYLEGYVEGYTDCAKAYNDSISNLKTK